MPLNTWLACLFVQDRNRYRSVSPAVDPARDNITRTSSYVREEKRRAGAGAGAGERRHRSHCIRCNHNHVRGPVTVDFRTAATPIPRPIPSNAETNGRSFSRGSPDSLRFSELERLGIGGHDSPATRRAPTFLRRENGDRTHACRAGRTGHCDDITGAPSQPPMT